MPPLGTCTCFDQLLPGISALLVLLALLLAQHQTTDAILYVTIFTACASVAFSFMPGEGRSSELNRGSHSIPAAAQELLQPSMQQPCQVHALGFRPLQVHKAVRF